MEHKMLKRLLMIAQIGLLVGGLIFLGVSIFGESKDQWSLCAALACICISNLFSVILRQLEKNK